MSNRQFWLLLLFFGASFAAQCIVWLIYALYKGLIP